MIALLSSDASTSRKLTTVLDAGGQLFVTAHEWLDLAGAERVCVRACVCASEIITAEAERVIRGVHRNAPALPIVLVTAWTPENAACAVSLPVDVVVWLHDASDELPTAVTRALTRSSLAERFARIIEAGPRGLDARQHGVLIDVCRMAPPVPSVAQLAKDMCLAEPKAREKLRSFFSDRPRAASRFLGWVALLVAHDFGRQGVKPWSIAERLAIDYSTLTWDVKHLTGAMVSAFLKQPPRSVLRCALEDLRLVAPPRRGACLGSRS